MEVSIVNQQPSMSNVVTLVVLFLPHFYYLLYMYKCIYIILHPWTCTPPEYAW